MLNEILIKAAEERASDIHLATNQIPFLRVDGDIISLKNYKATTSQEIASMLSGVMSDLSKQHFEKDLQADFAFTGPNNIRYRTNVYRTINGLSVAFREINNSIVSLEELMAPEIFKQFAALPKGLVIISGPTGSGKSTTLAAVIDYINTNFQKHIITIEDPIEFTHQTKKSLVNQREIGRHTRSFSSALKGALREDPDIIVIGEMRDPETIKMALTAAETGHLVFGTLHTLTAAKTIDRIIDACDIGEKEMVRSMLSTSIQAIILQTLLKKKEGKGRIAAYEILIANKSVKNMIREDKIPQIESMMQMGSKYGMITMADYVQQLVNTNHIEAAEANRILKTLDEEKSNS